MHGLNGGLVLTYVFYYIEAHLACIFLMAFLLFKIRKGVNKQLSQIYLGNLILVLIAYCFAEIFWALVDGGCLGSSKTLLYLSNVFTYLLISVAAYIWYILSEVMQKEKYIESDLTRVFISIPVWVSALLCITAYRTGLVYYLDDNGKLTGGKLYLILVIVPFGYLLASSIKALSRAFSKDRYADRYIYFMIGIFPIAPILLGILQAMYWRVPFVCYGSLAAVMYVYITYMDNLVSIDPLTQINNKNQMYKYLVQKMRNQNPGLSLFMLIIDIDKFKAINDTYGYSEGDKILIRVANAVKDACQAPRSRYFISRYGGDEFVVVAEMAYRAEASWLADQIKSNVKKIPELTGCAYDLSVSVGIAQYDYEAPISIQSFIARADSDLYKQRKLNNI